MLRAGESPSWRRASRTWSGEGQAAGPAPLRGRRHRGGGRAPSSSSCACPPPRADDGSADLVLRRGGGRARSPRTSARGPVVVNKSTVPGRARPSWWSGSSGRPDVAVVSNPEFLREGTAVHDSLHPDRIVVGADDQAAAARVGALFAATQAPLIVTDAATAETIKYASNAFLATKLSFVNAVAGLCEAVGADVRDVSWASATTSASASTSCGPGRDGAGRASPRTPGRWSTSASRPATTSRSCGGPSPPTRSSSPGWSTKVRRSDCRSAGVGLCTAARPSPCVGASPSRPAPTTGATRPPSRSCGGWWPTGATVRAFDPTVPRCRRPGAGVGRVAVRRPGWIDGPLPDAYAACDGAAAVVVLTEWDEFRWLDFDQGARPAGRAGRGRRPEPARPRRHAAARLRLRRASADRDAGAARGRRRAGPASWARTCATASLGRGDEVVCRGRPLHRAAADNVAHAGRPPGLRRWWWPT